MRVKIPYAPRPQQLEIHNSLKRFNVLICHRRFGKTVSVINHLIADAWESKKRMPRYAYIAPTYKQAKQIAWDYVKEYARNIPGVKFNEAELRCDMPNGARISLYGADNPDSLRGIYLDGVVFDEVAQMKKEIWTSIVRPALTDRKGMAIFIGTPKGHNFFWEIYQHALENPEWYTAVHRVSDTGIIDEQELLAARAMMSDDEYSQEFECSFEAAITGAYYGKWMRSAEEEGRVCRVPYDVSMPVDTWWDLGMNDSTSIWFTQAHPVSGEIRVVDYYENSGEGLQFYINHLDDVRQEHGIRYRSHNAPHDITVRELGTGKSRLETAFELGLQFEIVPKLSVDDGIQAVRNILNRCWFDSERCSQGIECLKQYKKVWDEKNGVFKARPLHDWTSHGADAFRYFATGFSDALMYPQGVDSEMFVDNQEIMWINDSANSITGY